MAARLVQMDEGRPVASVELGTAPCVIGRDPTCDFVVHFARVSRSHARIRAVGSAHLLEDLGSANGTSLNGRPLSGTIRLADGDHIELAGDAVLVYEDTSADGSRWLVSVAVLVLLLLGGGGLWWWLSRPDPVFLQAEAMAKAGVQAYRSGDARTAKQQIQQAVGYLYTHNLLDDVPRDQTVTVGLQRLGKGLDEDLDTIFHEALEQATPQRRVRPAQELCRLDAVGPRDFDRCLRLQVRNVLTGLRQDPDSVPDWFYPEVARTIEREHGFIERSLGRGARYVPTMKRELVAAKMPPLLHYLSLIESGYRPGAGSHAGAVGLWQFIPGTARRYGLKVGKGVDERKDPEKSTRAAARYLRDLAFEFGGDALLLALAGYNRGEAGVRSALKRLDDPFSERSYWVLVERNLLPEETQKYVPRFIAAAVSGEGGLPSEEVLKAAGY